MLTEHICAHKEEEKMVYREKKRRKNWILTPELIVVAAALGFSAAVARLTHVALVVNTFTVQ